MDGHDIYTQRNQVPSLATYQYLRISAGLSAKHTDAATRGLANTLFATMVFADDEPVGMGRVIGDGGCFFQVVDVAVLPAHQGRGLGKRIMAAITQYLQDHVPSSGYVSLIADGQAHRLYVQFGFQLTAPASVGMYLDR
ncbi:GNAT family N-acetyltransferase [Pinirhizobacter sp.]|jgi:GNAT superfamily N-acetyltransferase|uniref:GNAT family N-acetyltransferase n=1 Tax=Pinirhizobacter sp. TaxID=2950432 RepID=UPI002F41F862